MSLASPELVVARLTEIDRDLAILQNELEDTAMEWFRSKRDRELAEQVAYAEATGTAAQRKIEADAAGAVIGCDEEAAWEAKRARVRVLETRANIGMAVLKSQGRS